jgi:MoaA/NifB/PqqE/SkfB family radical SAM enzyme
MRPLRLALSIVSNRLGLVPRPSWCTYLVCYRCNARCKMCDSWRIRPGDELTPEEVRLVFAKIGRLDVVRLTGGEPFLRDDLLDVAMAVWDEARPAVLHITSNGSFPERVVAFAERFPRPARLRFMISFDGLEEEHDANRGADVTFATAFETVQRLVDLRERLGLRVSVNHTIISPRSLDEHEELCRRFAALGVDVHAVLAYSDSAMYGLKRTGKKAEDLITGTGYPLHPKLQGADVIGFVQRRLRELPRLRDPLLRLGKRYYLRGLLARLRNRPAPRPHPKCVALRSHIRLLPDGSVPVCHFNTEKVGNLLTQSFEDVWHGAGACASRAWVDGCAGCWAECEVMPSALYSGDLLLRSVF